MFRMSWGVLRIPYELPLPRLPTMARGPDRAGRGRPMSSRDKKLARQQAKRKKLAGKKDMDEDMD